MKKITAALFLTTALALLFLLMRMNRTTQRLEASLSALREELADGVVAATTAPHVGVPFAASRLRLSEPLRFTMSASPVLEPGPGWDSAGGCSEPSVIKVGPEFLMYYEGMIDQSKHPRWEIGLARSTDGINWTKEPNPVLRRDHPWEALHVYEPCVIHDAASGVFRMWYTASNGSGDNALGYATSRDGVQWEKRQIPYWRMRPATPRRSTNPVWSSGRAAT